MHTILVVEDEPLLQELLVTELTKAGFTVLTANDGMEGAKLVLSNYPDLILTDILMPNMDGLSMLQEIRKNEKAKHIPVIVLSNLSDPDAKTQALENEADGYIVKAEVDIPEVIKQIKKILH